MARKEKVLRGRARWHFFEMSSRFIFLFKHDLYGKPVSTFPDHALKSRHGAPSQQGRRAKKQD
jgi:hypothetical protein